MSKDSLLSPAIIVGCARSGTTMLRRVLNAHRDIQMYGETDFLVCRLWREAFENRFWFNIGKSEDRRQGRMADSRGSVEPERLDELERDRTRVARATAQLFADILEIDPSVQQVWGFKEIKNGAPPFDYGWEAFDNVFPAARWIHLVRNPLDHIRSLAIWNGEALTRPYLHLRLKEWMAVTRAAASRRDAGDFYLLRYEDLMADKEAEMKSLLGFLALGPDPACLAEFQVKGLVTSHRPVAAEAGALREFAADEIRSHAEFPSEAEEVMHRYEYEWPESLELVDQVEIESKKLLDPRDIKISKLKEKNSALRAKLDVARDRLKSMEESLSRRCFRLLGSPKKLFRKKG